MPLSKLFRFCLWWESVVNGGHFSSCKTRKKWTPVTFFLHMRQVFLRPGGHFSTTKNDPEVVFRRGRYSSLHRHTTLFQRCFKVDFRLRCWTTNFQRWNNVIDVNVGKRNIFQRCFNVRFQRWNNVRFQRWNNVRFQRWNNVGFQRWNNVIFQRWNNVIFQRWFVLTKSNVFSTLKFYVVSTLFQLVFACWAVYLYWTNSKETHNSCICF